MNRPTAENWWTRPCGGRDVVKLALPLVVSCGSLSLMHFVDRMFLLWYSPQAMAAAMPAGILHFTLLCFPFGMAMYVNAFVAQYQGAGRPERIGLAVWQGARIGLVAAPFFLATIPLAPIIFALVGHNPEVAALETVYYQVLTFGAGGMLISAAFSTFFTGRGATRVVMAVDCTAVTLNLVLDYAFIFGHFGLPSMGIEGAAWATVISQWFKVLVYWWLMMRPVHREEYQTVAGRRFDAELMRRILRYGGPNGLQLLVEVSGFSLFILLVGRLGEQAMIATTLAFNVNSVAFIPMLGLGIAISTMVGQQLGKNRPDMAARVTWTALRLALGYMGMMAALYLFVPDLFMLGHASGTSPELFSEVRDVTVVLLRFVAAYCLLDACLIVFVNAIKGAGDTRFILYTNLVMAPMPVLAGWWGIANFGWGLVWCWGVITVWISTLGVIYTVRFLQGHWRTMRVIEAEAPPHDGAHAVEPTVAATAETA